MDFSTEWCELLELKSVPNFSEIRDDPNIYSLFYKDDSISYHLTKFHRICLSNPKENLIISGEIGSGKTTFVHFFKDVHVPISLGNQRIKIELLDLSILRLVKNNDIHPDDLDLLEYKLLHILKNFLISIGWSNQKVDSHLNGIDKNAIKIQHLLNTLKIENKQDYRFVIIFDEIDHFFNVQQVEAAVKYIFRLIPHNYGIIKVVCARKETEEFVKRNIQGNFISKYFSEKISLDRPDFKAILDQRFRVAGASGKFSLPFNDKTLDDIKMLNNSNLRGMLRFCKEVFFNLRPKSDKPIQLQFEENYLRLLAAGGNLFDIFLQVFPDQNYAINKEVLSLIKYYGSIDEYSKDFLNEKFGFRRNNIWHTAWALIREELISIFFVRTKEKEGRYNLTDKGEFFIKLIGDRSSHKYFKSQEAWLRIFSKGVSSDIERLEEIFAPRNYEFYEGIKKENK